MTVQGVDLFAGAGGWEVGASSLEVDLLGVLTTLLDMK